MKHFLHIAAALSIFLFSSPSFAEKVRTSFTASDAVYDIAIQGDYVWCATANGPVRWDRKTLAYTVFNTIPDNRTTCMKVDSSGNIWFGTKNGVYKFDPETGQFQDMNYNLAKRFIIMLEIDADDSVRLYGCINPDAIGPGNYGWLRFTGNGWEEYTPSPTQSRKKTQTLVTDPDNVSWEGTPDGLIRTENGIQKRLTTGNRMPDNTNLRILSSDSAEKVWTVITNGVASFDGQRWIIYSMPDSLGAPEIQNMKFSPNGDMWLGTSSGIVRFDGSRWEMHANPGGLSPADIKILSIGPDGSVWIGTDSELRRFDGSYWNVENVDKPADSVITALAVGQDGKPRIGLTSGSAFQVILPDTTISGKAGVTDEYYFFETWKFVTLVEGPYNDFYGVLQFSQYHVPMPICSLYRFHDGQAILLEEMSGWFTGLVSYHDETLWGGLGSFLTNDGPGGGGLYNLNVKSDGNFSFHQYGYSTASVSVSTNGTVWAGVASSTYVNPESLTRYGEPLSNETVITSVSDAVPAPVSVLTNHPNPFNPSTTITFSLPAPGKASLTVYDITGRKVRTLFSERMAAGSHSVLWDGRDDSGRAVSSGVYLSRLTTEKNTAVGRMLLLK